MIWLSASFISYYHHHHHHFHCCHYFISWCLDCQNLDYVQFMRDGIFRIRIWWEVDSFIIGLRHHYSGETTVILMCAPFLSAYFIDFRRFAMQDQLPKCFRFLLKYYYRFATFELVSNRIICYACVYPKKTKVCVWAMNVTLYTWINSMCIQKIYIE